MSSEQSEWKIKLHSNQKEESIQAIVILSYDVLSHSLLESLNNDNKLTLNIIKKIIKLKKTAERDDLFIFVY